MQRSAGGDANCGGGSGGGGGKGANSDDKKVEAFRNFFTTRVILRNNTNDNSASSSRSRTEHTDRREMVHGRAISVGEVGAHNTAIATNGTRKGLINKNNANAAATTLALHTYTELSCRDMPDVSMEGILTLAQQVAAEIKAFMQYVQLPQQQQLVNGTSTFEESNAGGTSVRLQYRYVILCIFMYVCK